jgi:hypothetical protein
MVQVGILVDNTLTISLFRVKVRVGDDALVHYILALTMEDAIADVRAFYGDLKEASHILLQVKEVAGGVWLTSDAARALVNGPSIGERPAEG